jgi:hypothetical protein
MAVMTQDGDEEVIIPVLEVVEINGRDQVGRNIIFPLESQDHSFQQRQVKRLEMSFIDPAAGMNQVNMRIFRKRN